MASIKEHFLVILLLLLVTNGFIWYLGLCKYKIRDLVSGALPKAPTSPKQFIFRQDVEFILKKPKFVLIWQRLSSNLDSIDFSKCEINNCISTRDKSYLNKSAAVIFTGRENPEETIKYLPKYRNANQYWVYFNRESQLSTPNGDSIKSLNGLFNLTITYKSDSDIPAPYGYYVKKHPKNNSRFNLSSFNETLFKSKKLLVWIVSHCVTQSRRMQYFKQLQKYVQADIFGRCGPKMKEEKIPTDKLQSILQDYKFYFAAENSLCKEYVTEKVFYNALNFSLVPIVLGGADYREVLPPGSYIDIKHFESPEKLAELLKKLDKNKTRYMEYFKWKKNYTIVPHNKNHRLYFCKLCKLLNLKTKLQQTHYHLDHFWNAKTDCISPQDYYHVDI